MKLKNKKTGEVVEPYLEWCSNSNKPHSLAELNEEWEDAPEEPKEYWYIDSACDGDIDRTEIFDCEHCKRIDEFNKSIGNYFETKKEAKLAIRKLKAWKQLKDKGFRFIELRASNYGSSKIITIKAECDWSSKNIDDLDLLFGGDDE